MAAMDTNTMLLQILQQMEEQRRADRQAAEEKALKAEEQRRMDQQAAEERALKAEERQQAAEERYKAAEERNRRDVLRMFQEMQRGSRSTSTRPSTDRFPSLKIDFKEFSGESEDWNTWSRVHYAQLSALGCAAALTAQGDDDLKIGRSDFTDDEADPEQLRTAHQAWVSLITMCKGVAFDIVQGAESPGAAWSGLMQHYRASGLKERRRLTVDFYTMKMELGEHPRKFLLRVDQMVKELERVDRPVDSKDIDIVILSGLTPNTTPRFECWRAQRTGLLGTG